jgi:hypothetical protein
MGAFMRGIIRRLSIDYGARMASMVIPDAAEKFSNMMTGGK